MASRLQTLLSRISKRTTPTPSDQRRILTLAERLRRRVEEVACIIDPDVRVRVEGSVAKDTWLREFPDIDIFMQVQPSVSREALSTTYLDIAKKATRDAVQVERFAEHPYLEAIVNETKVNIVPCYAVEKGEWKSATDRTPFHTDYVKALLDEKLCSEVRLLKRFMKGINVYGAEIRVGGFSGYLCELLVLFYRSFHKTLKAAADWKLRTSIDPEGYYENREHELQLIFEEPLVIVDPVDKIRNAASAVRRERLDEFIAASRAFLKKPDLKFFYPPSPKPQTTQALLRTMKRRATSLIFIQLDQVDTVPDILWGQLYKSQRALKNLLEGHDFTVIWNAVWSDEKTTSLFLIEVENRLLPTMKKHLGPPLEKRAECESFLRKHVASTRTLSGPRLEAGRWVVAVKRPYIDAVALLEEKLEGGGKSVGVPELLSRSIAEGFRVMVNQEILPIYVERREFAEFLTEYLEGKPNWLA
jgi:tRNA nucleotidyltransferase (CCA-adding enzyme)